MKSSGVVSLAVLAASLSPAFSQMRWDIRAADHYEWSGGRALLVNHPTSTWDLREKSRDGIEALAHRFAPEEAIMVVHEGPFAKDPLNARESARNYYLSGDDVGLIVRSPSGEHRLQFPQGSTVYLAGGNFLLCLCEAFRDVLRGTSGNAAIVFVTDGIYHTLSRFAPAVAGMTEEELEVALDARVPLLRDSMQFLSDRGFLRFLRERLLGSGGDRGICPYQPESPGDRDPLRAESLTFHIFNESGYLGPIAGGGRKVELHFLPSRRVPDPALEGGAGAATAIQVRKWGIIKGARHPRPATVRAP